jgi:ArsR family transcriptional regulator
MENGPYKALADPTRRRILQLLSQKEMTAGELAAHFSISLPSMSHHFAILRNADLVSSKKDGQQVYYRLNTTVMQDLITALLDLVQPAEAGPIL